MRKEMKNGTTPNMTKNRAKHSSFSIRRTKRRNGGRVAILYLVVILLAIIFLSVVGRTLYNGYNRRRVNVSRHSKCEIRRGSEERGTVGAIKVDSDRPVTHLVEDRGGSAVTRWVTGERVLGTVLGLLTVAVAYHIFAGIRDISRPVVGKIFADQESVSGEGPSKVRLAFEKWKEDGMSIEGPDGCDDWSYWERADFSRMANADMWRTVSQDTTKVIKEFAAVFSRRSSEDPDRF